MWFQHKWLIRINLFCVVEFFTNLTLIPAYKIFTVPFTKTKVTLIISKQHIFKKHVSLSYDPFNTCNFYSKHFLVYAEIRELFEVIKLSGPFCIMATLFGF
jgi:hypothetical protein